MIRLDVQQAVLLGVLCAASHWLIARSTVFQPLWSRARGRLAALLACPSCSGWWLSFPFQALGVQPFGDPRTGVQAAATVVLAAFLALFLTPVFEAALLWGLERSALDVEPEQPEPPSTSG